MAHFDWDEKQTLRWWTKSKQNTYLYEIPVIGLVEDIPKLVHEYDIAQITIAIPSLKAIEYEYILDICNQSGVKFNLMPSVEDVLNGKLSVSRFRKIDVVDLLGREEVKLDMQQISKKLHGKTVLVSGADIREQIHKKKIQESRELLL